MDKKPLVDYRFRRIVMDTLVVQNPDGSWYAGMVYGQSRKKELKDEWEERTKVFVNSGDTDQAAVINLITDMGLVMDYLKGDLFSDGNEQHKNSSTERQEYTGNKAIDTE
jgi:hypothetical protein